MTAYFLKWGGVFLGLMILAHPLFAQKYRVAFTTDPQTGAIAAMHIEGDKRNMNWLVATDGSQYSWIKKKYGWGLGYFTLKEGGDRTRYEWKTPVEIKENGSRVIYRAGTIRIGVDRRLDKGDLVERYTFLNTGKKTVDLSDIGIYTPFNDNYPDAVTCENLRTDVHLWEGENAAYVNAVRMGGYPPHLGLVVTKGAINRYEISERGRHKANSQTRGIISLDLPDRKLKPGEKSILEWTLFADTGKADFRNKVLEAGSVLVACNKYVFERGEMARVVLTSKHPFKDCRVKKNGVQVPVKKEGDKWIVQTPMNQAGEVRFEFFYDGGKKTHATCLVINDVATLIQKRVDFIRMHQQMNDINDPRYGAYMVYDNEGDSIYLNNTKNVNPPDRDEGGERVGMGVLLAMQYLQTHNPDTKASLLRYAKFLRDKLQTKSYVTYSSVSHAGRNRPYNYPWIAEFYFLMYKITGDKQYVTDGYQTLRSFYLQFGHRFYAIGMPVRLALESLKAAGMEEEYELLKRDFIKNGDHLVNNGLHYPKSEVNFEQAIVAPSIIFLEQLYLFTGNQKYLASAKEQMPVLEAFSGSQPSYHLNGIANRYWDGYWFGKRAMWGDVFPHYWSTLTAAAYHYYYLCTKDTSFQERAEHIVRNNLCLFFKDGRASCAYIYPYKVDGKAGQFYDPYANDQDWALVYYKKVMDE